MTEIKNPDVSIIIPAYNAKRFIHETLVSVLNQSYESYEVIVVDDGSTDSTREIVSDFVKQNQKISLITKSHSGGASARNTGLEKARGKFIAFLDSDDLWYPDKLAKQVSCIEKDPSIGLVSCLAVVINEESISTGLLAGRKLHGNCYKKMLDTGGICGGSIVLVRRECFEKAGYFDPTLKLFQDWDMWIRLTRHFKLVTIPEVLVGYRRSSNCISRNYRHLIDSGRLILEKIFQDDPKLSKQYRDHCLSRNVAGIGAWCLIDGNYNESWYCVKKSARINFFAIITDFSRFSFLLFLILATILPKKLFRRLIMEKLLPKIFGLKYGQKFLELQST